MTADLVTQLQTLHADAFGWALHCCGGDFHLAEETLQQSYAKLGAMAEKNSPQDFARFIDSEVKGWAPIVKASGARVD